MSQLTLNNPDNLNVPSAVSVWFDKDWAGTWVELGDCVVDGVDLAPEFAEHRSYRNGINALRKRILTAKAGTINITLNEPNLLNLQRGVYGGTIETSGVTAPTIREGRMMQLTDGGSGAGSHYFDIDTEDTNAVASITDETSFEIFAAADYLEATDLTQSDDVWDGSNGQMTPGAASFTSLTAWFYVKYTWAAGTSNRTEIFGVSFIEGACQLQARNFEGGSDQIWYLNSVNLAPNGTIPTPLDAIQTIPITLSLQSRNGGFGYIYSTA